MAGNIAPRPILVLFLGLAAYGQVNVPAAVSNATPSPGRILPPMVLPRTEARARMHRLAPLAESERTDLPARAKGRVRVMASPRRAQTASVTLDDGSTLIRFEVSSPGAESMRLHFRDLDLGQGRLWVYPADASRERLAANPSATDGPITALGPHGDGEFWTIPITGDTASVELVLPSPPAELPFRIDELVHTIAEPASTAPCQRDVTCFQEYSQVATAVGSYDFVKDGFAYVCSGALVSTSSRSFVPYFATANHCISTQTHARAVVVYWDFRATSCNGTVPVRETRPSTRGARLLANNSMAGGDYSLLLLDQAPPGPRTFLGFSTNGIDVGAQTVGIHHPGAPPANYQRITFGVRTNDRRAFVEGEEAPAALFWQINETEGRTEQGSSGSPLMTRDGILVGTLSYGPVPPRGLTFCDIQGQSGYGRFNVAFPAYAQYLNDSAAPGLSVSVNALNFSIANGVADATQRLEIRNSATTPVTYTLTKSVPWINLSAATGTTTSATPGAVTVSVNPSLLTTPGTFEGIIAVTSGSLAPLNVTVRVTVGFNQSGAVISVAPNPVLESLPDEDGFTIFYSLRVDETAGVAARITRMVIDGADRSADIVSFFGTDQLPAFGGVGVSLRARLPNLPRRRKIEVSGVSVANGRPWGASIEVDFLPRPSKATLSVTTAPDDVSQNNAQTNCRWRHELIVQEAAGYSVQLNRWVVDGTNISNQIGSFFGSTTLSRSGLLRTTICWPEVGTVPRTIPIEIGGVDENGATVSANGTVRMVGVTTSNSALSTSVSSIRQRAQAGGDLGIRGTFRVVTSSPDAFWSITPIVSGTSKDWISVNPQRGRGTTTISVTFDPFFLTAGTYTGALIVQSSTTSPQFSTVDVQFEAFKPTAGPPRITGVVNGASFLTGAVAPGAWITIFGENLATTPAPGRGWTSADFTGSRLPTSLDGTAVRINGMPAAMFFVGPGQLNVQVPDTGTNGPVDVEVDAGGATVRSSVTLARVAPGLFQVASSGSNAFPAAVDSRGGLISLPQFVPGSRPARVGEFISLFGTGFGPTTPAVPSGTIPAAFSQLLNAVTVRIGGVRAEVQFAGLTGAGLNQINVRVPELPPGNHLITIEIAGTAIQANVVLPVN